MLLKISGSPTLVEILFRDETMKKLHAILLAVGVAAVVLLVALFKQSPETSSPAAQTGNTQSVPAAQWQNLLIEYPQGYVGAEQKLLYRFSKPAIAADQVGKADNDRISINPAIAFSTLWLDESTLQITPLTALPANTKIELTLHSKGLLIGQQLANFVHPIQVLPQQLSIREIGFGNTAQEQVLTYQFEVQTLEPIALLALKNMFEVGQSSGQPLPIEWQQQTPRAWRATISGIVKTTSAQTMTLSWKETPAATEFAAKRVFDIPQLDQFNLLSSQVQQENEQKFELRFSQMIGKQDLTGLVKLNDQDVRAKVNGNVIQLFPDSPLKNKVKIWISRQVKSNHEQTLGSDIIQELQVSSLLPEISLLDGGFILPQADRLLIPIEATNIKALQLRVFEIYSNNIGQYLQDTSRNWQSDYVNRSVGRYIDQKEIILKEAALNDKQQLQLDVTELVGKHRGSILRI